MRFLLLKEKYLELLESGRRLEALRCLRSELAPLPLHHSDKHIETLTRYTCIHTLTPSLLGSLCVCVCVCVCVSVCVLYVEEVL